MTVDEGALALAVAELRAAGCTEAAELVEGHSGVAQRIAVHSAHAVIEVFKPRTPAEVAAHGKAKAAIAKVAEALGVKLSAPDPEPRHPRRPMPRYPRRSRT